MTNLAGPGADGDPHAGAPTGGACLPVQTNGGE
jgi:hypothetical protein